MSSTDISVLVALVSLATQFVEKVGLFLLSISTNWNTGRVELQDYSRNVEALERLVEEWDEHFRMHGISGKPALASRLKVASSLLEHEQTRAKDLEEINLFNWKRWKRRLASLAFPNELSFGIKRVKDAFEDINTALQAAAEVPPIIKEVKQWEPAKLGLFKAKYYTANKRSWDSVKKELESDAGAEIVVLYGEPGSGKTSLAKELGLEYQMNTDDWKKKRLQPAPDAKKSKPPMFSDGVFFVDCGPAARITTAYKKLLKDLGTAGRGFTSSDPEGSGTPPDNDSLKKELEASLYELSALVIVDNVCDTNILGPLIVPGVHRKYLVTTQNANCICVPDWANLILLKMEKMDREAAVNLLLKRLSNEPDDESAVENLKGQIKASQDLQTCLDEMIEVTNGNPQALVCFTELLKRRVLYQERWQEILDRTFEGEFYSSLENEVIAKRLGHSSTISSSMIAPLDALRFDQPLALDLLLFLALCRTPVPETVLTSIHYFLDKQQNTEQAPRIRRRGLSLAYWLEILEKWSLVEEDVVQAPWDEKKKQKTYSVSRLRKEIIREKKREELSFLIMKLLSTDVPNFSADGPWEGELVAVLCAAYGDEKVEELQQRLEGLGLGMDGSSEFRTRRSFALEAVWLLHSESGSSEQKLGAQRLRGKRPTELDSTQEAHKYGKKMIVQVLSEGTVDKEDISKLLQLHEPFPLILCQALKILLTSHPPSDREERQQISSEQNLMPTTLSTDVEAVTVGSSSGPGACISIPQVEVPLDSDYTKSVVTRHMRGLTPTMLLGYITDMKNHKKTPSLLVQQKALELVRDYTDKAKDRKAELIHFVLFVDTQSTLDAMLGLQDWNKTIENEVLEVKRSLSSGSSITDSLQNLKNSHADSVLESEVLNTRVPSPSYENLVKRLAEVLEKVHSIRLILVHIIEILLEENENENKIKAEFVEKLRADSEEKDMILSHLEKKKVQNP